MLRLTGHQLCSIEEFSEENVWDPLELRISGAFEPSETMVRNLRKHHTTVGHTLLFTFDRNMYAGHKVWEACFAVTNDLQDGDIVIVCSDPAGYPSAPTAIKEEGSGERTYTHFFED